MPWFNFAVNCNMAICNWTVPDIMVSFSMPLKDTAVLRENFAYFFSYSAIKKHPFMSFGFKSQRKRMIDRGIEFKQFRYSKAGPLQQSVEWTWLQYKTGNVVARSNPYISFSIPCKVYNIFRNYTSLKKIQSIKILYNKSKTHKKKRVRYLFDIFNRIAGLFRFKFIPVLGDKLVINSRFGHIRWFPVFLCLMQSVFFPVGL